jgi:hypothetical protein
MRKMRVSSVAGLVKTAKQLEMLSGISDARTLRQ